MNICECENDRKILNKQIFINILFCESKKLQKQVESCEETANANLGKYRRLQHELEESEERAEIAESKKFFFLIY